MNVSSLPPPPQIIYKMSPGFCCLLFVCVCVREGKRARTRARGTAWAVWWLWWRHVSRVMYGAGVFNIFIILLGGGGGRGEGWVG